MRTHSSARLGVVPFDHGAQCVSVRSSRFRAYVEELVKSGYAAPWHPRIQGMEEGYVPDWYVGTPGMSALVRPLAESVQVHTSRREHTLQRIDKGWRVWFDVQRAIRGRSRRGSSTGSRAHPRA